MNAVKIISVYAKTDLFDAAKWYENQQKGLGKQFFIPLVILKFGDSEWINSKKIRIFPL